MFNLFKKSPPETTKISGVIKRCGANPDSEYTLNYVFLLENNPKIFECSIYRSTNNRYDFSLSKEGDEVSFEYLKNNEVVQESFRNKTLNLTYTQKILV